MQEDTAYNYMQLLEEKPFAIHTFKVFISKIISRYYFNFLKNV